IEYLPVYSETRLAGAANTISLISHASLIQGTWMMSHGRLHRYPDTPPRRPSPVTTAGPIFRSSAATRLWLLRHAFRRLLAIPLAWNYSLGHCQWADAGLSFSRESRARVGASTRDQ